MTDLGDRLAAQSRWLHLLCFHLAGARIRARVDSEDLVQEVFLRVLASRAEVPPHGDGELRLRQLLAQVARHCVLDVARHLRRLKRASAEVRLTRSDWSTTGVGVDEVRLQEAGPATRAGQAEDLARVLAAFERLSPEHRRVIGLRQFEGLSAKETASRMGRSEAAVHSLYRRALLAWGG